MRGFLLANLFLLAIVLIAAGLSAIAASILSRLTVPDPDLLAYVWALGSVGAMFGTYYISRAIHRALERRVAR